MNTNQVANNVVDMTRQMKRSKERDMKALQEKMRKEYNSPVTRGEFQYLMHQFDQTQGRASITIAAILRAALDKQVFTKDEFQAAFKHEEEKQKVYKEIQTSKAPYKELLDKCKEWDIPIWATNLHVRIKEDKELPLEEKLKLGTEYNIPLELLNDAGFVTPPEDAKEPILPESNILDQPEEKDDSSNINQDGGIPVSGST